MEEKLLFKKISLLGFKPLNNDQGKISTPKHISSFDLEKALDVNEDCLYEYDAFSFLKLGII